LPGVERASSLVGTGEPRARVEHPQILNLYAAKSSKKNKAGKLQAASFRLSLASFCVDE
jgi:hypothetical protein